MEKLGVRFSPQDIQDLKAQLGVSEIKVSALFINAVRALLLTLDRRLRNQGEDCAPVKSSARTALMNKSSLIRNSAPLAPYSRPMPRALWWF